MAIRLLSVNHQLSVDYLEARLVLTSFPGRGAAMPVIVFASPKGGVGKSTSAVLLATELAQSGAAVTVIDADPNRPVS
jgi:Mrp family chromosome partitioning ATPase